MTIVWLQLSHHNRPYKNPYRLQMLSATIQDRYPSCNMVFFDIDAGQFSSIPSARYAVVDTTETEICDIPIAIRSAQIEHLFLLGDVVRYGDKGAIQSYLKHHCPNMLIHISDESSILSCMEAFGMYDEAVPQDELNGLSEQSIFTSFREKGLQYIATGVSEGCEMQCAFCIHSCCIEPVRCFACPSLQNIQHLYDICKEPVLVQFSDENFFGPIEKRMIRVFELAKQLRNLRGSFRYGVDTRIDSLFPSRQLPHKVHELHEACWQEMLAAGLNYCFLGVESFSQSQLRRYNKDNDLLRIPDCINYFEKHSLSFTLGLILWDPLMTEDELRNNLSALQSLNLLGKTASLWKPLRISYNSLYRRRFFPDFQWKPESHFFLLEEDIDLYVDSHIRAMARYVFPLYHVFDSCGYRHSDASCYAVLLERNDPAFLRHIPRRIAELELQVLRDLLGDQQTEFTPAREKYYLSVCKDVCEELLHDLFSDVGPISSNAKKLTRCYVGIFSRVVREIDNMLEKRKT